MQCKTSYTRETQCLIPLYLTGFTISCNLTTNLQNNKMIHWYLKVALNRGIWEKPSRLRGLSTSCTWKQTITPTISLSGSISRSQTRGDLDSTSFTLSTLWSQTAHSMTVWNLWSIPKRRQKSVALDGWEQERTLPTTNPADLKIKQHKLWAQHTLLQAALHKHATLSVSECSSSMTMMRFILRIATHIHIQTVKSCSKRFVRSITKIKWGGLHSVARLVAMIAIWL